MKFLSLSTPKRRLCQPICSALALLFLLSVPPSFAQRAADGPFADLAGSWSGRGTITMSNGRRERIRCNAQYRVTTRTNVRVEMTCSSDSYRFDLRSNTTAIDRTLSGTWSEATRGVAGQIVGRIAGNQLQIRAEGQTFTALLDLTTRGNRQSVSIRSPGSEMSEVKISLTRRSR